MPKAVSRSRERSHLTNRKRLSNCIRSTKMGGGPVCVESSYTDHPVDVNDLKLKVTVCTPFVILFQMCWSPEPKDQKWQNAVQILTNCTVCNLVANQKTVRNVHLGRERKKKISKAFGWRYNSGSFLYSSFSDLKCRLSLLIGGHSHPY